MSCLSSSTQPSAKYMPISSTILSSALPLSSSFLSKSSNESNEVSNENKLSSGASPNHSSDETTLVKMDESIKLVESEFNRPTTPPPSTPSPPNTQVIKNVNKRKIKVPNNHQYAKKPDEYSDDHMEHTEDELDDEEEEGDDEDELDDEDDELRADDGTNELLIDEAHPIVVADSEADLDPELDMDENNNNSLLPVGHTLTAKEISKEILELNTKLNSEICNDLIVCGRCQTDFKLSDIILFIEHKIQKCSHALNSDSKQTSKFIFV